ncbi:MAG: DUF3489 domain-containing protein [Syntrophaceae bacterium]|nr:DUF3489 domain-containing protein [Syntrophaceae bacterium]
MKRTEEGNEKKKVSGTEKVIKNKPAPNLHVKSVKSEKNLSDVLKVTQGQSKQETLIKLLTHPNGATMVEMAKLTGWQHHSIRGVISGVLRKRLGLSVLSTKDGERGRIYRIGAGNP